MGFLVLSRTDHYCGRVVFSWHCLVVFCSSAEVLLINRIIHLTSKIAVMRSQGQGLKFEDQDLIQWHCLLFIGVTTIPADPATQGAHEGWGALGPTPPPKFSRHRLCIVMLMDESARVHVAAEISLGFRVLVGN